MPSVTLSATGPDGSLLHYFDSLYRALGPQNWWPAKTRLEVILGAILTQNTSWQNAALALKNLRKEGLLTLAGLRNSSPARIEDLIQPSGYYRQKARTIRNFLDWLDRRCAGSLAAMFRIPSRELCSELNRIKGLGRETVDAILLYAGGRPFFVADAYTRRVLSRHGLLPADAGYAEAQEFLHAQLPPDSALFNEFHALLVEVGKSYCKRPAPLCRGCPLEPLLPNPPHGRLSPMLSAGPSAKESRGQIEA
jgi:endonuclease III related protein